MHDLDDGPDTGDCMQCGGHLRQGDEPLPDYTKAIQDILPEKIEILSGKN